MPAGRSTTVRWVQFPYTQAEYDYGARKLEKSWKRLHSGDREPWPDARRVAALQGRSSSARALVAVAGTDAEIASSVQEAWRAFHRGEFERAWRDGAALGPMGIAVAVKAAGVHATYLEDDARRAEKLLLEAVELAARGVAAAPGYANAHYFHAFALGRYSQRISIVKALAAGHATRVRRSLERALELEPAHADAHVALGVFHAEVVSKVGGIAARVTYGASADEATRHFERALKLCPDAPVIPMEYANGLLALHGDRDRERALRLYERAAACVPADAMERLDVEQAKAGLD